MIPAAKLTHDFDLATVEPVLATNGPHVLEHNVRVIAGAALVHVAVRAVAEASALLIVGRVRRVLKLVAAIIAIGIVLNANIANTSIGLSRTHECETTHKST